MAGSEAQVAPVEIRQLTHLQEFEDIFEMQRTIWSYADSELIPMRFLAVVAKVGGHIFGAYDGARMIGFCFAIPGIKLDGRPYLHSHMLGVLPEYRNAQIGRRLKLRQRDDALARGIGLIEWTFDPLELKNAFLNIEKLGAIVRVYKENQYGTTTSPLHGGLPTDRCTAEWWIGSPRVHRILDGGMTGSENPVAHALLRAASSSLDARDLPVTPGIEMSLDAARTSACATTRISYPADIATIRRTDSARAREIQRTNAQLFMDAFGRGLAVTGFERTETEGTYLLETWQ